MDLHQFLILKLKYEYGPRNSIRRGGRGDPFRADGNPSPRHRHVAVGHHMLTERVERGWLLDPRRSWLHELVTSVDVHRKLPGNRSAWVRDQLQADLLGGSQAQRTVEVRTFEGELVGKVTAAKGEQLITTGLGVPAGQHVRLKLGIRWHPNSERPSPPPDLRELQRRQPGRYADIWAGNRNATAPKGKGMLGRCGTDEVVFRKAS